MAERLTYSPDQIEVVDADTLNTPNGPLRIKGGNAPETAHPGTDKLSQVIGDPGGQVATDAMKALLDGRRIRVDVESRDAHGRTVGKVYYQGDDGEYRDALAEIIGAGLADPFTRSDFASPEHQHAYTRYVGQLATDTLSVPEEIRPFIEAGRTERAKLNRARMFQLVEMARHDFLGAPLRTGRIKDHLSAGVDEAQAGIGGFVGALGRVIGSRGMQEAGEKMAIANLAEAALKPATIDDWDDVDGLADFFAFAVEQTAREVPGIAVDVGVAAAAALAAAPTGGASLAAGAAGATGRRAVAEGLRHMMAGAGKKFIQGMGGLPAQAGFYTSSLVQNSGETYNRLLTDGENDDGSGALALGAGAAKSVLDLLPVAEAMSGLKRAYSRGLQEGATLAQAAKAAAGRVAASTVAEGGTEAAQEGIDQAALTAYTGKDYYDAGDLATAALLGGTIGGSLRTGGEAVVAGAAALRKAREKVAAQRRAQAATEAPANEVPETEVPATEAPAAETPTTEASATETQAPELEVPNELTPIDSPNFGPVDDTPTSFESVIPEPASVIQAQAEDMLSPESGRVAVEVIDGSPEPQLPEDAHVARIKTEKGVALVNLDKVEGQQAAKRIEETGGDQETMGEVLYGVAGKPENADTVVRALREDGTPVAEVLTTADQADAVAAQVKARATPDARVETTPVSEDTTLEERVLQTAREQVAKEPVADVVSRAERGEATLPELQALAEKSGIDFEALPAVRRLRQDPRALRNMVRSALQRMPLLARRLVQDYGGDYNKRQAAVVRYVSSLDDDAVRKLSTTLLGTPNSLAARRVFRRDASGRVPAAVISTLRQAVSDLLKARNILTSTAADTLSVATGDPQLVSTYRDLIERRNRDARKGAPTAGYDRAIRQIADQILARMDKADLARAGDGVLADLAEQFYAKEKGLGVSDFIRKYTDPEPEYRRTLAGIAQDIVRRAGAGEVEQGRAQGLSVGLAAEQLAATAEERARLEREARKRADRTVGKSPDADDAEDTPAEDFGFVSDEDVRLRWVEMSAQQRKEWALRRDVRQATMRGRYFGDRRTPLIRLELTPDGAYREASGPKFSATHDVYVVDFETFYDDGYSLEEPEFSGPGGYAAYVNDPRFRAEMVTLKNLRTGEVEVISGHEAIRERMKSLTDKYLVAHNATFDAAVFHKLTGTHPAGWLDTLSLAQLSNVDTRDNSGRPRYDLGTLARALGVPHTKADRAALDAMRGKHVEDLTEAERAALSNYARLDTLTAADIFTMFDGAVTDGIYRMVNTSVLLNTGAPLGIRFDLSIEGMAPVSVPKQAVLDPLTGKPTQQTASRAALAAQQMHNTRVASGRNLLEIKVLRGGVPRVEFVDAVALAMRPTDGRPAPTNAADAFELLQDNLNALAAGVQTVLPGHDWVADVYTRPKLPDGLVFFIDYLGTDRQGRPRLVTINESDPGQNMVSYAEYEAERMGVEADANIVVSEARALYHRIQQVEGELPGRLREAFASLPPSVLPKFLIDHFKIPEPGTPAYTESMGQLGDIVATALIGEAAQIGDERRLIYGFEEVLGIPFDDDMRAGFYSMLMQVPVQLGKTTTLDDGRQVVKSVIPGLPAEVTARDLVTLLRTLRSRMHQLRGQYAELTGGDVWDLDYASRDDVERTAQRELRQEQFEEGDNRGVDDPNARDAEGREELNPSTDLYVGLTDASRAANTDAGIFVDGTNVDLAYASDGTIQPVANYYDPDSGQPLSSVPEEDALAVLSGEMRSPREVGASVADTRAFALAKLKALGRDGFGEWIHQFAPETRQELLAAIRDDHDQVVERVKRAVGGMDMAALRTLRGEVGPVWLARLLSEQGVDSRSPLFPRLIAAGVFGSPSAPSSPLVRSPIFARTEPAPHLKNERLDLKSLGSRVGVFGHFDDLPGLKHADAQRVVGFVRGLLASALGGLRRGIEVDVVVHRGDPAKSLARLFDTAPDSDFIRSLVERLRAHGGNGYFNAGGRGVIVLDGTAAGINPAEVLVRAAHEAGHYVFDRAWAKMPDQTRAELQRMYQHDTGATADPASAAFREWYADRFALAAQRLDNKVAFSEAASGVFLPARELRDLYKRALSLMAEKSKWAARLVGDDPAHAAWAAVHAGLHGADFAGVKLAMAPLDILGHSGSALQGGDINAPGAFKAYLKRFGTLSLERGLFAHLIGSVARTTAGRIRQFSPRLADMLYQRARDRSAVGESSFEHRRLTARGTMQRVYRELTEAFGNDDARLNQALLDLRNGEDTEDAARAREAIREINRLAQQQGWRSVSPAELGPDFVPAAFDHAAIEARRNEFAALLREYMGDTLHEDGIQTFIDNIIEGRGVAALAISPGQPVGMHQVQREVLRRVGTRRLAEGGWLNDNMVGALGHYIEGAARRAAWEATFGGWSDRDQRYHPSLRLLEELDRIEAEHGPAARQEVESLIAGGLGNKLRYMPRWLHRLQDGVLAATNLTVLAFSGVMSIPELGLSLVRNGLRFGDLGEVIANWGDTRRLARDMGVVMTSAAEQILADVNGEGYEGSWTHRLQHAFFTLNGNNLITRLSRTISTGLAVRAILRAYEVGDVQELGRLNLSAADVRQWIAGGRPVYSADLAERNLPLAQAALKVQTAVNQFVTEASLYPNRWQATGWGNNPYFRLVWHLKQFLYTMGDAILGGIYRATEARYAEARSAGADILGSGLYASGPVLAFGVAVAPLAIVAGALRNVATGDEPFDDDLEKVVSRMGAFGPAEILLNMHQGLQYDRNVIQILSPAAGRIGYLFDAGEDGVWSDEEIRNRLRSLVPVYGQLRALWVERGQ